jgi:soluble lytic murein transglycosylase
MRGSRLAALLLLTCLLAFAPRAVRTESLPAAVAGVHASPPPPPPASPTTPGARTFDPASTRLAADAPERAMRAALDQQDTTRASLVGQTALTAPPPGGTLATRGRLLWLLAVAELDAVAADARLQELSAMDHPLARWAALRLGERWSTREPAKAAALLEPLTRGWVGAFRARLALALAKRGQGEHREAIERLRALLAQSKPGNAATGIAMPLAELLAARKDAASLQEALELCRRVSALAPTSTGAARADELAKKVLGRLPARLKASLSRPSVEDQLARGEALMDARRYDEARKLLDQLSRRLGKRDDRRCKVGLELGRAMFYGRDRESAAKHLSALARRCDDADIKAWARYHAASSRLRTHDPRGAVAEYDALVRDTPQHSLADDALFLQATAYEDLGDPAAMRKALERVLSSYPNGDQRAETLFALAFEARTRGDHAAALTHIDALLAEGEGRPAEGAEGRASYWRARTLHALSRLDEAKAGYAALIRAWPLAYHAQQAHARLLELDPALAAQLGAELRGGEPTPPLTFAWRSELDTPGFAAAVELLRVGETELAELELRALGAWEKGDEELAWLAAAVLDATEAHAVGLSIVRQRLRGFRNTPPQGRARHHWRLAYPRAYAPLIDQVGTERGVPPELIRAVAREESSFDPRVVSTALAYGLIQVIPKTAKIHATALSLPSDPASLKRPEVNLRIGSHFLSELRRRYATNPAVVPAAYNAGYAAADRWLRERATLPLDEWVERIPYRETRRYTRRVLQSVGVYGFLDRGELPVLAAALPPPSQ